MPAYSQDYIKRMLEQLGEVWAEVVGLLTKGDDAAALERIDQAYDDVFIEPGRELGTVLLDDVEPRGPQGLITGTAAVIRDTARVVSASENGFVRSDAFAMIAGLAVAGVILAIVVAGVA